MFGAAPSSVQSEIDFLASIFHLASSSTFQAAMTAPVWDEEENLENDASGFTSKSLVPSLIIIEIRKQPKDCERKRDVRVSVRACVCACICY